MGLYKEFIKSKKTLTDKLLDEITDYDIYCELIGEEIEIGRSFRSPLREDDTRASFSLFIPDPDYKGRKRDVRPDEVWWVDFTGGAGDVFQFVRRYAAFHHELELSSRKEIIQFLDEELSLGLFEGKKVKREKRTIDYEEARKRKDILFKSREFTRRDIYWWAKYAVDEEMLRSHNVRSLDRLLNDDYTTRYTFRKMELAFAYVVYDKVKIYRPEADPDFKWRNTCPAHYLQGAEQCTRNDVLIITKSMKDLLCFKSLMYVDAIAIQGEGMKMPQNILEKIKKRYKKVYVVMDYDSTGIDAASNLEKEGFTVKWVSTNKTIIDGKAKVMDKDISDYIYNHGVTKAMARLQEMFDDLAESSFRVDRVKYFEELVTTLENAA